MNIFQFFRSLKSRPETNSKRKEPRRFRPRLDLLEDRMAPAVLTVTSTADNVANDGLVTLREAITAANLNANLPGVVGVGAYGADTINFNIATGLQTIHLLSALPALVGTTTIAGNTQPGFSGVPLIELDGTAAVGANGLILNAPNCVVRSLVINNFQSGIGIAVFSSNGRVEGCYIGTDSAGAAAAGNGFYGVLISGTASGVRIGGGTAATRNVISGNGLFGAGTAGVAILGTTANNNLVQGNYIGTDVTGTVPLGNGGDGIRIFGGADFNIVGGVLAGQGNVISGNNGNGVAISGIGTMGNRVQGNFIGSDFTGNLSLGNVSNGVMIFGGAAATRVGGIVPLARNIISGNNGSGIEVSDLGTNGIVLEGNFIGVTASGLAPLANNADGVLVTNGAQNVLIGGTAGAATRNIISGNSANGVEITLAGTMFILVQGNYIGVDLTGNAPLANSANGVRIGGAANNTVGGTAAGTRNVISGNSNDGVDISGAPTVFSPAAPGTTGNKVQGNYIGVNAAGNAPIGNLFNGVRIEALASNNTVGGTALSARNVISGNSMNGVEIHSTGTTLNLVQGNLIGTDFTGTVDLGNTTNGVRIANGADNNTVGGTAAGARNIISGNNSDGVEISNTTGPVGNRVQGNYIGTNAAGTAALGNTIDGVSLQLGAAKVTVGGLVAAARNVISGNSNDGVLITDAGTANLVQGNYIGTNAAGNADLGNSFDGVELFGGASLNTVGGLAAGARNVISGNNSRGVVIGGPGTTGNLVQGNFIGVNAAGLADLGNSDAGVSIALDAAFNTVGGTLPAARNVISGNDKFGVFLGGLNTTGNAVRGNYIGVAANGTTALANTSHGVFVTDQAADNIIGGIAAGAGNSIRNNGGDGVLIGSDAAHAFNTPAGIGNSVLSNSIFNNVGDGIDLGPNDGPTAANSDSNDADSGPNDLINTPTFPFHFLFGSSLFFVFSINTTAFAPLRVEFFASPSGSQGQSFLGFANVTTNASGNYVSAHWLTVPAGSHKLTATITDQFGNTSEFSLPMTF